MVLGEGGGSDYWSVGWGIGGCVKKVAGDVRRRIVGPELETYLWSLET